MSDGVEAVSKSVGRARALQEATSKLELSLYSERLLLEGTLARAKSELELAIKLQDAQFRAAYEELEALVGRDEGEDAKVEGP